MAKCSKCPSKCPTCHQKKSCGTKKCPEADFRLIQYGKKRRVGINKCAPKLKCQHPSCQSYAACTASRVACDSTKSCVHKPNYGGALCC